MPVSPAASSLAESPSTIKLFEKFRWLLSEIPCPGTALVSVTGCAGIQRRAVSRRPTVILAHEPGACRPAALVDIDNPGRCRVQLVARGLDREYLAASAWIPAGQHHASFDLPDRFSWIVLEVDPLCESSIGRIRYRPSASICAPTPTTVASGWESSRF